MKFLRDSLYSFLGAFAPMVISLVTLPLFISTIGAERYGALWIAWLLLGYFGQADFGIGRAVTQKIASMADATPAQRAELVCTALATIGAYGIFVGIITVGAAWFYFAGPLEVAEGLRHEMLDSVWLLGLCSPAVTIFGVMTGSLIGQQQFRLASFTTFVSNTTLNIFPLVLAMMGISNLEALIAASLASRVLGLSLTLGGVWTTFFKGQRMRMNLAHARELLHFGKWVMVTTLIGPFMIVADRFIVGMQLGAAAVAAYTVPFVVANRTQVFPTALLQVLFPRFAADGDNASLERCRQFTVLIGQLYAPLIIGLTCLAAPLLSLWLGGNLDHRSILVGQIMLAGFWINSVAGVPYAYIQARGRPRFTAILHVCELPVYFLMLFAFGAKYGLAGIAAAFSLRCGIDCALLVRGAGIGMLQALRGLAGSAMLVALAFAAGPIWQEWLPAIVAAVVLGGLSCLLILLQMPLPVREGLARFPLARHALSLVDRFLATRSR